MNRGLTKLGYRPKEAAESTGTGLRTIYRAIAEKQLVSSKIGRSRVIRRESLEAWLLKNEDGAQAAR